MSTPVIMPKFEMAQETGKVLQWLKEEGASVEKGEAILEVETDKVTMEVEAPASGTLVGIRARAGAEVPVTEPIAYIVAPGEAWPGEPEAAAEAAVPLQAPASPPRITPVAERMAEAEGIDLMAVRDTGPGGQITKSDIEAYLTEEREPPAPFETKVRAVPAARRLAREMGVDLTAVSGTGPDGRIQSEDVRQAAAERPAVAPPPAPEGRPPIRREIPLTGMRRTIAERMTTSVREAPQFTVSVDVSMGRALAIVEDLQAESGPDEGLRVTLTTFLVKACAWALVRHPALNTSLQGANIVEWAEINIGVAVAVEEGLIVPVIHQASELGVDEIAASLADLTARARAGRLRPGDVQGGTFTLSNLGMFNVDRFTAILNPPQAAILAVGRVTKRPVAAQDDRVEVQPMAALTLTADHRVVDGAIAARFLDDLQLAIERPGVLLR